MKLNHRRLGFIVSCCCVILNSWSSSLSWISCMHNKNNLLNRVHSISKSLKFAHFLGIWPTLEFLFGSSFYPCHSKQLLSCGVYVRLLNQSYLHVWHTLLNICWLHTKVLIEYPLNSIACVCYFEIPCHQHSKNLHAPTALLTHWPITHYL